jgi:flagellar M-ring protein FliF
MDFISQAYAQVVELIRSMSVGTRWATGLLLAAVVISLAYLFQFQATSGDEFLLGGRAFTQSELTAIEAAFAQAGLGQSQIVGGQIRIPRGKKDLYLAAMADGNALPADFYKYFDEAIAAHSPFENTRSLDTRQRNAKQKELSLIIGRMNGIDSATVVYDEETKRGLVQQKQKTAMVAVQSRSGHLEEDQVKAIRNVVASAYAGLDRKNITITDLSGATYGGAIGPDGMPEDESIYAAYKQRFEREYQRKIQQQLAYIPGVIVGVNAELNPEMQNSSTTVKLDPKPVTVATKEMSKEMTSRAPLVAGRPGAASNGVVGNTPVALQQTAAGGPESQTTETQSDVQNVPGHDTTLRQIAPLIPKKVTASIDIPASYFVGIWKKNNPQPEGKTAKEPDPAELATIEVATKKRIQETVRNLLPDFDRGTDPYPHVVVETYADLPRAAAAPPALAETAKTWLADNWQTLAVVGVGLLSLMMLRSMVRSPASVSPAPAAASHSATQPRLAVTEAAAAEEDPEPVRVLKTRFQTTGPDLKTELQDIVKENPDAAAAILRSWIGEAA